MKGEGEGGGVKGEGTEEKLGSHGILNHDFQVCHEEGMRNVMPQELFISLTHPWWSTYHTLVDKLNTFCIIDSGAIHLEKREIGAIK